MSEATTSNSSRWAVTTAISLTLITTLAAIYAWWPKWSNITNVYILFPLFGLLAFSIMWCHYVMGALLRVRKDPTKLARYFRYTGYIVLACLLLHPGLLIYKLWSELGTLPPNSYVQYVGEASKLAVIFGSVGLLCFLLYETKHWLSKSFIWAYVVALSDVAMILIFIHGLRLGSLMHHSWYRYVWIFYGIVLIACIGSRLALANSPEIESARHHETEE
jgi:hypothetical protein